MQLSIQEFLTRDNLPLIDVRTSAEFKEGSVSGAICHPLFNEEERAVIGKLYRSEGRLRATQEAYEFVANKLPQWLDSLLEQFNSHEIAVICWRGGMRSLAVVQLLRSLGYSSFQILGGYKAYRNHSLDYLSAYPQEPTRLITLFGLTGCGKSLILRELKNRGVPVIDLEQLAIHRGSAFGQIGLEDQPTQQGFDSKLFNALSASETTPYLFVEGESRRIGRVLLPPHFMHAMQTGLKILVSAPLACRAHRIVEEYGRHSVPLSTYHASISSIEKRLGLELATLLHRKIEEKKFAEVAEALLAQYYDQCYDHARKPSLAFDLQVESENLEDAVRTIEEWYHKIGSKKAATHVA